MVTSVALFGAMADGMRTFQLRQPSALSEPWQPLHSDVGISGGWGCDGCGGEQGKGQGDAQEAPPGKRGWGGWEVHERAFQ